MEKFKDKDAGRVGDFGDNKFVSIITEGAMRRLA
jgi:hypothetical protein